MIRKTLVSEIDAALDFLESFNMFTQSDDLKEFLKDPSMAQYHERIKGLLKAPQYR